MNTFQKISLFLLRVSMGWFIFYAGITKVLNPEWSAAGYLKGAKTFVGFYEWLLQPNILPSINFLNEWGLTLVGISLILGLFVRLGSIFGAALMVLYYFPILNFPYPNPYTFLIDDHIIYALVMILLATLRAGRVWGLENWCSSLPICSRYPKLRNLLG
ncbi:MAG: DoxX family protein [Patescibacteria group bacterium]